MNLNDGLTLEKPSALVKWGINEESLIELLGDCGLRNVTEGYYTITAQSLGGMVCEIGFHFEPRRNGRLSSFEFFRRSYPDQEKSYNEFQAHFENEFGKPSKTEDGNEGFPSHTWQVGSRRIVHYVFDRFGPEEHMRIS